MEKVSVNKADLIKQYNAANKTGKQLLEKLHGKAMFQPNIMDQVKTFEDACKVLGIKPNDVTIKAGPVFKAEQKALQAQAKLIIIARALNQGWLPDWSNSNQAKWYPWFRMGAGFGFSHSGYVLTDSGTNVCSRLYYKTDALATYAGKQFAGLYKDFLSI
jgi:hypothetical protein